jgi:CO/xanthine dehydrogenase FAD-binding subunit
VRSALSTLEVLRPRRLSEALAALGAGERPVPMAGGTDLFVYLNAGTQSGARFLDLSLLAELRGVRAGAREIVLGAGTTFWEIRNHEAIRRRLPSLAQAAAEVGAWQIQHRATIGGNIANASPAGDSLPVLLAHEATVLVASSRGERRVRFDDLYTGYRRLAIEADELILSVSLPVPPSDAVPFFRKVGTRRAQSISKVVFCALASRGRGGKLESMRLAFGSMAPTPLRARAAEAAWLEGGRSGAEAAREALSRDLAPIDDIRSDRAYRQQVAENLLTQFARVLAAR